MRSLTAHPARQPPAAATRQRVKFQLDRVANPDCVAAVVLDSIRGQRVDQHVEPVAVEHQIRYDMLELIGLENDQGIADRVRSARRITEFFDLDIELLADRGTHPLGARTRLGVVIDVGMIAEGSRRIAGSSRSSGCPPCRLLA